jgi:hypothetical protein
VSEIVDHAVAAVRAYYEMDRYVNDETWHKTGYAVGGSFHVWADDGNEGQIPFCRQWAEDHDDQPGIILGHLLALLTPEQEIEVLIALGHGGIHGDPTE